MQGLHDVHQDLTCNTALCRGLPVQRYTREQTISAYWGIGLYWGKAQSNNKKGHLIGHIKDIGYDPSKPTTRLYATKEAQPWHNDSSDMVGMSSHAASILSCIARPLPGHCVGLTCPCPC